MTDFCPCNCKPADIFYVLTFCVTFETLKFDFRVIFETADLTIYIFHFILELMTMFKEILKASRNNQASIFAFTFKFKILL